LRALLIIITGLTMHNRTRAVREGQAVSQKKTPRISARSKLSVMSQGRHIHEFRGDKLI